jgi:hypothetical protein
VQHPDLLSKHSDTTLVTYKRRQIKHLKHTFETLEKHLKTLKIIANITQHPYKTLRHMCEIYATSK